MTAQVVQTDVDARAALIARAVVLIAIGFGLVFAFVVPPLGGFDEPLHFLRAWQVSDGTVLPTPRPVAGGRTDLFARVPRSLPSQMRAVMRDGLFAPHHGGRVWHHLGDRAAAGPKSWEGIEGAGAYSPVPYLPAAVAIRAGRALGLSTLALVQLARIAQVLAYALLAGLAVRRVGNRALVLAVVALAPVALIQAGSVSADPVTIGLALLVLAEAVALLSRPPEAIGWPRLLEIGAAVVALALAKPPYLVVAALLLVAAWRHRGRVARAIGGAVVVALGLGIAWNRWAQAHYVLPQPGAARLGFSYAYHDVSPSRQTRYVEENPWGFVKIIGHTLARYTGPLFRDTLAQSPSWPTSRVWVVATLALVAATLILSPRTSPGRWVRMLGLAIAIVLFVAVFFLAYVGWNAVAAPRVDALQGRYLLPVVAVLAVVSVPGGGVHRARGAAVVLAGSAAVAFAVAVGIAQHVYF